MFYYIFLLLRATLRILTAFAQEAATEGNEVYEQPAAVTVEAIPEQPVEDPVPEPIPEAAVPEKAIIDEDRRKNAELIEEAFYQRKNLHPDMHDEKDKMIEVPENVDAMLLAKVLRDPEMAALITSMAKAIEKKKNQ